MAEWVPFKGQIYADIINQCSDSGKPWEDPEFPANAASLVCQKDPPERVEWKRPKDICAKPHLVVKGRSPSDASQGQLGNCWFVAACASLAQEKELWEKVVPDYKEQDWDDEQPETHWGAFHFRFWRFNQWLDVVIDDRLPTRNNKLIYLRSLDTNEFWSALLEKAYAKLNGCYETLEGGSTADALVDFTGGVAETVSLTNEEFMLDFEKRRKFYKSLKKYSARNFLMSASITDTSGDEMPLTEEGLVKGHAYGVTAVKTIKFGAAGLLSLFNTEKAHLVRLRNPWGEKEWNGAWSDRSPEWKKVSESQRKSLGIIFDDDGEFWMPFDDFCTHFTKLVICRMPNKRYFSIRRTWHETVMISAWKKGQGKENRAGGSIVNNRETFLQNPQFMISVDSDKDEIILCLTQPDMRAEKIENKFIGFNLMKVEDNREHRLHFPGQKVLHATFIDSRSVFEQCTLERGRYVVLATTFDQGEEGPLMMRIFSDEGAKCWELVEEAPTGGHLQVVSQIRVLSASGLQKQDHFGGADPYVILRWDDQTIRSPVIKNTVNPEFNFSALLYREKPQNPIVLEIWNNNIGKDQFMGGADIDAPADNQSKFHSLTLHGRGDDTDETTSSHSLASVSVVVHTTDDLEAF